jgi:sulfite reductase alpha subunit-like flavoprotein
MVWEAERKEKRLSGAIDSDVPSRPERTTPVPSATSGVKASSATTTASSSAPSSTWSDGAVPKVTILYGSQTGNSEGYAKRIGAAIRAAADAKCAVNVVSMETYEPEDLINEVSTTVTGNTSM